MTKQFAVKYRLFFGTVMAVIFTAIIILDAWLDGSLTGPHSDDKALQATILCLLVAVLMVSAQRELGRLATAKNLKSFSPLSEIASVLLATTWYWRQLVQLRPLLDIYLILAFTLLALFVYQYARYGASGALANCGANYFSIIYVGVLSAFVLGIRIDFGPRALLMFVFAVKCADIGAYAVGTLFGRHKLAAKISPGKTWEGMAGAVAASILVSVALASSCDIMSFWPAVVFGLSFAFIGQLGDLAESMLKRDAEQKDSASKVPGFGGILDIVDSPLVAAPFAYLFFKVSAEITVR
ncbi:MAG: phosphatidate cytidylyltransferase [Planctomycetota bacterium]|jgi:phosphatidate cytidylyltransferase